MNYYKHSFEIAKIQEEVVKKFNCEWHPRLGIVLPREKDIEEGVRVAASTYVQAKVGELK